MDNIFTQGDSPDYASPYNIEKVEYLITTNTNRAHSLPTNPQALHSIPKFFPIHNEWFKEFEDYPESGCHRSYQLQSITEEASCDDELGIYGSSGTNKNQYRELLLDENKNSRHYSKNSPEETEGGGKNGGGNSIKSHFESINFLKGDASDLDLEKSGKKSEPSGLLGVRVTDRPSLIEKYKIIENFQSKAQNPGYSSNIVGGLGIKPDMVNKLNAKSEKKLPDVIMENNFISKSYRINI
jgi:hypothetical protein